MVLVFENIYPRSSPAPVSGEVPEQSVQGLVFSAQSPW